MAKPRVLPAIAVTVLSLLLALGACELLARAFLKGGLSDRVELLDLDGGVQADCYPVARGVKMMFDLRQVGQVIDFFKRFHRMQIGWPGDTSLTKEEAKPMPSSQSLEEAWTRLRHAAPLCILYDTRAESPRFLDSPPGFKSSLALLGDSFTFGQGVPDAEVLPAKLARKTGWRVRSYARPGANIAEILAQFDEAMKDRARLGFKRIVYVYVPNDPYLTPELQGSINLLNDLMNVRLSATPYSSLREVRFLGKLAPHSALAAAILHLYSSRVVARRTLHYYEDAHDPEKNGMFPLTFDKIKEMKDRAAAAGIDFVMAAYPLMLDMRSYPVESINRHLGEQAKRVGVDLFDLLPAFQAHAGEELTVHPIDLHPNARASEVASQAIADFLNAREHRLGEKGRVVPNVGRPVGR